MKLHLGCGIRKIPGYTNVDFRSDLGSVDIADDIRTMDKFENGSADVIYSSHVLEHFTKNEFPHVLKRWYDLLKDDGTIRLAVPHIENMCKYYLEHGRLREISGLLYGRQDYPANFHYNTWDFETLKNDLERIGFSNVEEYDWRETDHAHIHDFSQAHLPHIDFEGFPPSEYFEGTPMSLNVTAKK